MCHQVQLSPAASHRPTAVLGPDRTCRSAAGPLPAADVRTPHPVLPPPPTSHPWRSDLHGHLSPLRQRVPDKPKVVTQIQSARSCHDPAPCRLGRPDFPRRGKRPKDTADTWRAASSTGPSEQRSASKAHDRDRPARYPELPVIDLRDPRRPQIPASPNDRAGHPILLIGGDREAPRPRAPRLDHLHDQALCGPKGRGDRRSPT